MQSILAFSPRARPANFQVILSEGFYTQRNGPTSVDKRFKTIGDRVDILYDGSQTIELVAVVLQP